MTSRTEIQFHCRHSIDFSKFDCTQHVEWGILLPAISYHFVRYNGKHVSNLQKKIKKRDEE